MLLRKSFNILILLSVILSVSVFAFVPKSEAAAGTMYVSPAAADIERGNTFNVSIRINPGTSVDTVQASLSYSTAYLQLDSMSLGVFSSCLQQSAGGGSVNLTCAMLGSSTSSDSLIANITFTALAGSGATPLSLSGNAAYSGAYTNPGASGAQISFYSPAAPAPVSGGSTVSTGSHKSSGPSSGASATPTSPSSPSNPATPAAATNQPTSTTPEAKISLAGSKVQFTTASFTVKSNQSLQTIMKYGTSKNKLDETSPASNYGHITLDNSTLTAGTKYYYQVVATLNGQTVAETPVSSFTTRGYSLSMTILDSHYRPVAGKVVYLHSAPVKAITNSQGVATFNDVPAGYHHIEYTLGGKTYSEPVYVADNMTESKGIQTAPLQTDAVILSGLVQPKNYLGMYMTLSSLLIICLLIALWLLRGTVLHVRIVAGFQKILLNIRKGKFAHV